MLENPVMKAVRAELPYYPGVKMEPVDRGGKHRRVLFSRGDERRFLTVPRSPSDHRAANNAIRDFRKTMRELGAERIGDAETIHLPKRTAKRAKVASFGISGNNIVFHVPKESKVLKAFRGPDGKATGHWEIYFRSSPDLAAPPMLALKRVTLPPGTIKKYGISSGFAPGPGAWRITLARASFPQFDSIEKLASVPLTLFEQTDQELVFKFPSGTLPTAFRKPAEPETPAPVEARQAPVERREAPVERREAPAPVETPTMLVNDQPITLQLPKQGVSVEAAIAVLNKAKRRLGDNLRFTIVEGGYLTAVHRIGL